ncbi:MAG: PAS domain S-box protein [Pseudomonadota bacterium]
MTQSDSPIGPIIRDAGVLSLEGLLESILASVPDAMIVINETGTILAMSEAAETVFGYSLTETVGQNVRMLMTDYDLKRHDGYMQHYMDTGEKRIIGIGRVVKAQLANGHVIPVDLKIGEAKFGEHRLFTGYIRDLSDQRKTEVRMQEMQADLTHFSRLSTVGTMASAMAHELNQPLTSVTNYLEAARDLLEEPTPETIDIIKEALSEAAIHAVRTGKIVRKLRDYVSRGEIETRTVPLKLLLEDAVSLALMGDDERSHTIQPKIASGITDVDVDPIQIQQVVVNLVRNALEATADTRTPLITVDAVPATNRQVKVRVSDNGHGFNGTDPSDVFRPFSSSKSSGMGLGLSICQTIIDAHGGEIVAFPNDPEGAVFSFTLNTPIDLEA